MTKKIALYPGSFDPPTNGHLDIIEKGSKLFDKVIVAVMINPDKKGLFSVEERMEMLNEILKDFPNVEADSFNGLTVDFAAERKACVMLRGLRALSDFDSEFQLSLMNRRLNKDIQTVFLMTGMRWIYISSSIIKQAAQFGGEVKGMVPDFVRKKLKQKYKKKK
jgi:pantetheine-phosphate adenylyltransferase